MNSPWFLPIPSLEQLNARVHNSLVSHLGIVFTELTEHSLSASMPVDERTVQPMRRLHGGASAALAETLGSVAAMLCLNPNENKAAVGIELNINHVRSAFEHSGSVKGIASPIHIGKTIQVWDIKIQDANKQLLAVARLTLSIIHTKS